MNEPDAPQSVSAEEEARIAETPAVFANKVFVSPQPGGAKITFAEARRATGENLASPRVAVFLQHADLSPPCAACSTGPRAPPICLRSVSAARCTEPGSVRSSRSRRP